MLIIRPWNFGNLTDLKSSALIRPSTVAGLDANRTFSNARDQFDDRRFRLGAIFMNLHDAFKNKGPPARTATRTTHVSRGGIPLIILI